MAHSSRNDDDQPAAIGCATAFEAPDAFRGACDAVSISDFRPELFERAAYFECAVERAIIPRLALARRAAAVIAEETLDRRQLVEADTIERLTAIVTRASMDETARFVQKLLRQGVPPDVLCLDVLAPTARRLGDLWVEDLCPFTDVTIGVGQLHHVMHTLVLRQYQERARAARPRRAVLCHVPGEMHTFGISMVAEFFRRAFWDISVEQFRSERELRRHVSEEWYELVGFGVTGDHQVDNLATSIRVVRKASLNRDIMIMVGGNVINERPELISMLGADATAHDGRSAVRAAESLVGLIDPNGH